MIRISCNSELSGRGGGRGWVGEGFCCKLIDSNNDPDAMCSAEAAQQAFLICNKK